MIHVVRHAKVTVEGVCYGQCDVPTMVSARVAAEEIAAQLAGVEVDAIDTSPTARTRPVAEALAEILARPLRIEARIAELSMGEWEGRTFADIASQDAARYARWMERWREEAPPGGETVAELFARVGAWASEAQGQNVLAVTHAGVIRALRARAASVRYEDVAGEPVAHLRVEAMRNLR